MVGSKVNVLDMRLRKAVRPLTFRRGAVVIERWKRVMRRRGLLR